MTNAIPAVIVLHEMPLVGLKFETLGTGCNVEGSGMKSMVLESKKLVYRYDALYS